jgi:mono/diheme cytochrome c family protein
MPLIARHVAGAIIVVLAAVASQGAQAADARNGEQIAQRWCATCHLVSNDQRQASTAVPTFPVIARIPNFTAAAITFFLLTPHPKMPDMALSRRDAEDIAAYIASLK